jgi:hypothetical protein
MDDAIVMTV